VERQGDDWGPARPLGPAVNTPAEELSPSIAADGTLYFASNRDGGRGSLDLWRARPKDGDFAEPENLRDVNSPGPDGAPCISADQRLLVFASVGRPDTLRGRGHYYARSDLYVSDAAGAEWGAPRHLGPPINTPASESNPSFSPDGAFLFFSSDRGFAAIPMEPAVTARGFEEGVRGIGSAWSNVYRIDALALRESKGAAP
jgi:Tol biopolymer transport system component